MREVPLVSSCRALLRLRKGAGRFARSSLTGGPWSRPAACGQDRQPVARLAAAGFPRGAAQVINAFLRALERVNRARPARVSQNGKGNSGSFVPFLPEPEGEQRVPPECPLPGPAAPCAPRGGAASPARDQAGAVRPAQARTVGGAPVGAVPGRAAAMARAASVRPATLGPRPEDDCPEDASPEDHRSQAGRRPPDRGERLFPKRQGRKIRRQRGAGTARGTRHPWPAPDAAP